MTNPLNHFTTFKNAVRLSVTFISALLITAGATAGQPANNADDALHNLEISGISLSTPRDKIAEILAAQGYTAVNSRLFTKQGELQNNRRTIFRVEVEDIADKRLITYHRSLTGGRVKTAGDKEPVPEYEKDTAQQFYRLICDNIPDDTKVGRQCEPLSETSISAGYGRFVPINDQYSLQLNVTAVNSAIGIQYTAQ